MRHFLSAVLTTLSTQHVYDTVHRHGTSLESQGSHRATGIAPRVE
jgi:hypothetical protein